MSSNYLSVYLKSDNSTAHQSIGIILQHINDVRVDGFSRKETAIANQLKNEFKPNGAELWDVFLNNINIICEENSLDRTETIEDILYFDGLEAGQLVPCPQISGYWNFNILLPSWPYEDFAREVVMFFGRMGNNTTALGYRTYSGDPDMTFYRYKDNHLNVEEQFESEGLDKDSES